MMKAIDWNLWIVAWMRQWPLGRTAREDRAIYPVARGRSDKNPPLWPNRTRDGRCASRAELDYRQNQDVAARRFPG
jgi:hypothetical protein